MEPARAGFTAAFDRFYTHGFGTFSASTAAQPFRRLLSTLLSRTRRWCEPFG
jgi:acyl dehydratase